MKKERKGFWRTLLEVVEEANVKVKNFQDNAMQKKVEKMVKKDLKKDKKENI